MSVWCLLRDLMHRGPPSHRTLDLVGELTINLLVCVEGENVLARGFINSRVFLSSIALPFLNVNLRAKRLRDLHGAVGRARVDDDYFSFAPTEQRHHAFKRTADVGFFVVSDDDDREGHGERIPCRATEWEHGMEFKLSRVPRPVFATARWRLHLSPRLGGR